MFPGRAISCVLMEGEEHFTLGHDALLAIALNFPLRKSDAIFLVCFIDWINQQTRPPGPGVGLLSLICTQIFAEQRRIC